MAIDASEYRSCLIGHSGMLARTQLTGDEGLLHWTLIKSRLTAFSKQIVSISDYKSNFYKTWFGSEDFKAISMRSGMSASPDCFGVRTPDRWRAIKFPSWSVILFETEILYQMFTEECKNISGHILCFERGRVADTNEQYHICFISLVLTYPSGHYSDDDTESNTPFQI